MRSPGKLGLILLAAVALVSGLVGQGRPSADRSSAAGHAGAARLTAATRYFDNGVLGYGTAGYHGSPATGSVTSPVVGMASTPSGGGYWLATASGRVYTYGNAEYRGSARLLNLASPVVAIAATPSGRGYWLATAAGGVYAYGDAKVRGSDVQRKVVTPIVDLVPTRSGQGYWLVTSNGAIKSYGDARWHGGLSHDHLTSPVVGMARTGDGKGYWLVTASGSVANFGDAAAEPFRQGGGLTSSVSGIAASTSGQGYWLVTTNGSVRAYGDARYYGSNGSITPTQPDAAIVAAPSNNGYWILEPDAFNTSFTVPGGGSTLGRRIVSVAASRVYGDAKHGAFCNDYGPCEAWCALFATYVWEQAGVNIPRYAFTGDVYDWSKAYTRVTPGSSLPQPGWAVLYGTGPQNVNTSVHMGIVTQVWKDGFIDTVEGDAGPAKEGHYGVVINGPYLISQTSAYNGVGIYGFAVP